jgi:hypothetical protein
MRTGHCARELRRSLTHVDPRSSQPTVIAELSRRFPGMRFESVELIGEDDPGGPLTVRARATLCGSIGRWSSRWCFRPLAVPAEAQSLASAIREDQPVELPFPFLETLAVRIRLESGMTVDLLPSGSERQGLAGLAKTAFVREGSDLVAQRTLRIDHAVLEPKHAGLVRRLLDEVRRSQELVVVLSR